MKERDRLLGPAMLHPYVLGYTPCGPCFPVAEAKVGGVLVQALGMMRASNKRSSWPAMDGLVGDGPNRQWGPSGGGCIAQIGLVLEGVGDGIPGEWHREFGHGPSDKALLVC